MPESFLSKDPHCLFSDRLLLFLGHLHARRPASENTMLGIYLTSLCVLQRSISHRNGHVQYDAPELSRKEIANLFFETHNGAMARMIKSFLDEEAREEAVQGLAAIHERNERRKRIAAEIAAAEAEGGDPAE